jgi:ParB family chromosome partitioning protein
MSPHFSWVAIDKIGLGHEQPRQFFDDARLQELAQSIATHGILQPLILQANYTLVAGERRLRAAKFIGLKQVPCMVMSLDNQQQALIALLENIQREQMDALEEALAIQRLQLDFAWTHQHIAKCLGKSRSYVTNLLRLLKCNDGVQQALRDKKISYGHAKVLVGLSNEKQLFYVDYVHQTNCSVRHLEKRLAFDKKNKIMNAPMTSEYQLFTREIAEQVGTQVDMDMHNNGEGWLKFKFFNQETLIGLLQRLGISYDE